MRARSEEFVEQILQAHFGYLISWIKEAERKLENGKLILVWRKGGGACLVLTNITVRRIIAFIFFWIQFLIAYYYLYFST